mgnify:CR=1 FL=1
MNILFLGDIFGNAGCNAVKKNLSKIIKFNNIDFVIANGENSFSTGVGISENIANELFSCGVDVITSGNHIWDQKETLEHIKSEKRLLRPKNMSEGLPGEGFGIFKSKNGYTVGVLNLMGNVYMKKCEDVFPFIEEKIKKINLKKEVDFLAVDFHAEITSEKQAMGHFLDGKATFVVGTHTHTPTLDYRILEKGTAYQTDAGMCGDYDSVIGMNKENSLNRFMKKDSVKHFPAIGEASLSGVIVNCNLETGLADSIESYIFGGLLKNT